MKNKYWFTFIELIVVITIIAILWTIWFLSYNWYVSESRDASRVSQISSMYKALESYRTKWFLPLPDRKVIIYASWTIIWYQWYIWEDALNSIWYQDLWKDPKDNEFFTYYLTKDLRKAQLMAYLEDELEISYNLVNQVNAANYIARIPKVYWAKLGILTESSTKAPIQEVPSIVLTWWLDIVKTLSGFTAYITDTYKVSWTWSVLAFLKDWAWKSCKDILSKDSWRKGQDWAYYINPTWNESLLVYCDMTTAEWWWTLVSKWTSASTTHYWNNNTLNISWLNNITLNTTSKLSSTLMNLIWKHMKYTCWSWVVYNYYISPIDFVTTQPRPYCWIKISYTYWEPTTYSGCINWDFPTGNYYPTVTIWNYWWYTSWCRSNLPTDWFYGGTMFLK